MKTENEISNARNCQMNNNIDFNYEKSSKNGNSESPKIPGRMWVHRFSDEAERTRLFNFSGAPGGT